MTEYDKGWSVGESVGRTHAEAEIERLKQRNAERERAIFRAGQNDVESCGEFDWCGEGEAQSDAEVDAAIADATKGDA